MSPPEFAFPKIFEFPPMFTKQINEQTWQAQLAYWDDIVLTYCKHYKLYTISVFQDTRSENKDLPFLFKNPRIQRELKPEVIRALFKYMVDKGHGDWVTGPAKKDLAGESTNDTILVYFQTPQEWANVIKKWIDDNGLVGSVITLYELSEGDDVTQQDFYGIPTAMLEKVADVLVQRGQAVKMKDEGKLAGLKFV